MFLCRLRLKTLLVLPSGIAQYTPVNAEPLQSIGTTLSYPSSIVDDGNDHDDCQRYYDQYTQYDWPKLVIKEAILRPSQRAMSAGIQATPVESQSNWDVNPVANAGCS